MDGPVVVVGAGPAGAAVAIELRLRGREVVMVDRARFPRPKACGEGLFPGGVRVLEKLGVLARVAERSAPLSRLRFHAGGELSEAAFPAGAQGLGVRWEVLDAALIERAGELGTDVRGGVVVTGLAIRGGRVVAVRTAHGEIAAAVVVAADGLNSRLRRIAGLDRGAPGGRFGVTGHLRLPRPAGQAVEVYFRRGHEVYVTPVGASSANVAVLARRAGMRRFAGAPEGGFAEVVAEIPALAGAEIEGPVLAAGPFPRRARRAWRGNVVLAGDAAGFFDGISGEGMTAALRGAEPCARAVDDFLESGDVAAFRAYGRERARLVRNPDLVARLTLQLSRSEWLARRSVRALGRHPETFDRLLAVNAGEAGLGSLRPRDGITLLAGR